MAMAAVASVIRTGTIRRRPLASLERAGTVGGGTRLGRSTTLACSGVVSDGDMTASAGDDQDHRRQHDDVDGEDEQCRVPDMPQQAVTGDRPAQADGDE